MKRLWPAALLFGLLLFGASPAPAPPPHPPPHPVEIRPEHGKTDTLDSHDFDDLAKVSRDIEVKKEQERKVGQKALLTRLNLDERSAKRRLKEYRAASSDELVTISIDGHAEFDRAEGPWTRRESINPMDPSRLTYRVLGKKEPGRLEVATALLGPLIRPQVAIIDAVPRDREQFVAVFGKETPASVTALRQVRESSRALDRLSRETSRGDDVFAQIGQTHSDIVLIVGHNDGGIFRAPSGRSFDLQQLERKCAQVRKLCIFLTCSARKYLPNSHGPTIDITAAQAARIAKRLASLVAAAPLATARAAAHTPFAGDKVVQDPWKLTRDIDDMLVHETLARGRATRIGVAVGTFLVVVAIEVVTENDACTANGATAPGNQCPSHPH